MGLKKLFRKAVKLGGKIAKPILAATPAGQIALRAQQTLKSLGGNIKAARMGKIQPLSVRSSVEKIVATGPKKQIRSIPRVISLEANFPGSTTGRKRYGVVRRSSKRSKMPQKRKTAPGTSKRVPPKGGLDLKAMAAQWRAAGKPGTWLGWIKANPIKKAS